MTDAESTESKEKSNFRFFRFLFFELWSFFDHFCDVITPIFDEFFTITRKIKIRFFKIIFFILFSTFRIIHKNRIKTEASWEKVYIFENNAAESFFIFWLYMLCMNEILKQSCSLSTEIHVLMGLKIELNFSPTYFSNMETR